MTTADGRRAFIRVDAAPGGDDDGAATKAAGGGFHAAAMTNKTSLLSQPIDAMLDRIEVGGKAEPHTHAHAPLSPPPFF